MSRADLAAYTSAFKTPSTGRQVTTISVDGGGQTAVDLETTLDVETIAGLAPGADIRIYAMPDLSDMSINDAYNQVIADGVAKIASMSFAGCEGPYDSVTTSPILQNGVNSGVTFVASSGDQGNECYNNGIYQPGVQYPASDPNVVGVGGNETPYGLAPLTKPVAWNDSYSVAGQLATGGGVSAYAPLPSFQSGLPGLASTQYRNVPDVSLPAVGAAIYESGWGSVLGTSWSAPQFAAMLAEIREYCRADLGNVNARLYSAYRSAGSTDFIDVTGGNNQFKGTAPFYVAAPGYDNATGLGLPLGMPLAQTMCPNRVLTSGPRRAEGQAVLSRAAAVPYVTDLRPAVRNIQDAGRRTSISLTSIQIVLRPTATLASDEAAVVAALRAAGLTITRTFANHLVIDARGPAGAIESLFQTTLDDFDQPGHGIRYAPVSRTTVPGSLAPYVSGIILDNVVRAHHLREP